MSGQGAADAHPYVSNPDAIIGATALARNALLITNDAHFVGIAQLAVQGC
jgi:predicted nucleic acid-binding protein